MSLLDDLTLGFGNKRLPVFLQSEAAECGLACLSMIASFHGYRSDPATLRNKFSISLKGTTLGDLIRIAAELQLAARPLRLELDDIGKLQLPCVLHWNFDHFVVLQRVTEKYCWLHDPAVGRRRMATAELSGSFTGVALELWPDVGFKQKSELRKIKFKQLMGRVTGLHKGLAQSLALAAALEVFTLVSPFFIQWVVDQAIVSADQDLLSTLAVGFALLMVLKSVVSAARSWVLMHMSTVLNLQWRANVFTHLLRLPVPYFQKRHLGDVNSRFGSIDQIQNILTTSFLEAILDGIMSVATVVMMFIYSKVLASVAVVTMLLYGVSRWLWYGAFRNATNSQIILAAKQQSHFLESIRGVRAIKLFQMETRRRASWLHIMVDQINAGLRTQKLQIIYSLVNSLLVGTETVLVIWLGAKMVLTAGFSVGELMAFKSYDDQFSTRLSAFIDKLMQFRMLRVYGDRLADIVWTEPEKDGIREYELPTTSEPCDIFLSNVKYRYAEHEPLVINGVSLRVKEGESVAIVGPSGCGKSTLVGIVLGILPPTSGNVSIGGRSVRHVGPGGLRAVAGSVMQDDVLFAGSIRENIAFFDSEADLEWVVECARMAGVHDEIVAMPMGYNSLVGDMGTVLSGGQKQRVILARALYKKPRILVLDEATSHLDVAKEREVNQSIMRLKVTRIIVAHRPETIAAADRVVTLGRGKIVSDVRQPTVGAGLSKKSASAVDGNSAVLLDTAPRD